MTEEWRKIEGYPNYSVSNLGRVRNDKTGRFLSQAKSGHRRSYLHVCLFQGSGHASRKTINIHRLVADAFIPNPDSYPEVNHIDGNGFNNIVSNLEWVTHTENMIHAYTVLHPSEKPIPKKVIRIEDGQVFDSVPEASHSCGVRDVKFFTDYLDGKKHRPTIGGYHWKYLEDCV